MKNWFAVANSMYRNALQISFAYSASSGVISTISGATRSKMSRARCTAPALTPLTIWAIEEMGSIAQIVSGVSAGAVQRARDIFERVAPEIVEMTPLEAEYAKLICNAFRYIEFATANQFFMMLEAAGLDYHRLLEK